MDELTERKQRILRAVVLEYVESAEPVGSSLLVERYKFGVGPATVRHELSEMSDRGYLDQPHTSAGRVPSDVGYRYFVNRLAEPALDARTLRKVRELSKNEDDLETLLSETCKVLSRLTHYVSVAATFPEKDVRILSIDFAGITRERLLMTVVFSNGLVDNKILDGRSDMTLGDLHKLSVEFGQAVSGDTTRAISRKAAPKLEGAPQGLRDVAQAAWRALRLASRQASSGKVVSEGTHFLLEHPEFRQDVDALSRIVSALEDSIIMHEALDAADPDNPVTIGRENISESLYAMSIVAGRFFVGDKEAGAIAVVGPRRMRYASAIPLVETAARALTDALTRLTR